MKDKFLKSIQRKSWLLLALFFISSCSNEDIVKHPVITNKYDPSKPQALTGFIPEKGGIGDKIIVQGNFGTDLSKMKVIFADTKEANIISTYIIHSGFISGYQNRYGDNLKPPTNVYHRMTA